MRRYFLKEVVTCSCIVSGLWPGHLKPAPSLHRGCFALCTAWRCAGTSPCEKLPLLWLLGHAPLRPWDRELFQEKWVGEQRGLWSLPIAWTRVQRALIQGNLGSCWSVHRGGQGYMGSRTCTKVAPRSSKLPGRAEWNLLKRTVLMPGSAMVALHEGRAEDWRQETLHAGEEFCLEGLQNKQH